MEPQTLGSGISTTSGLALVDAVRSSTWPRATLIDGLDALLHGSSRSRGLDRGDVVEIQGVTASGKTQLLTKLALTHVLPRAVHVRFGTDLARVRVGGNEQLVAWFDCTASKLDLSRLAHLARCQLALAITQYRRPRGIAAPDESELDRLVGESLARLHVFTPTSTLQLACTIHTLPEWYDRRGNGAPELGLVVIDAMTEFAWSDQHERERERGTAGAPPPPLRLFSAAVAHLRQTLSPLIFISQWVLRPLQPHSTPSQQNLPLYRHHFNPPLYPSLADPPRLHKDDDDDDDDVVPRLGPGSYPSAPDAKVFPVHFHITLHPAPRPTFRKGVPISMVLSEGGRRLRDVESTRGIVCVLRQAGGHEVGSWEMEIRDDEIIA